MLNDIRLLRITMTSSSSWTQVFASSVLTGLGVFLPAATLLLAAKVSGNDFGWTPHGLLIFLGIYHLSVGVVMTTVWPSAVFVLEGKELGWFDTVLLFPGRSLILLGLVRPQKEGLWLIFFACVLLFAAGIPEWSTTAFIGTGLFVAFGIMVVWAACILFFLSAIRWPSTRPLMEAIGTLLALVRFPREVYPAAPRVIFFSIVPFGLVAAFPTEFFVGYPLTIDLLVACVSGAVLLLSCSAVWHRTIRHYQKGL